jgi:hypothetical protein
LKVSVSSWEIFAQFSGISLDEFMISYDLLASMVLCIMPTGVGVLLMEPTDGTEGVVDRLLSRSGRLSKYFSIARSLCSLVTLKHRERNLIGVLQFHAKQMYRQRNATITNLKYLTNSNL